VWLPLDIPFCLVGVAAFAWILRGRAQVSALRFRLPRAPTPHVGDARSGGREGGKGGKNGREETSRKGNRGRGGRKSAGPWVVSRQWLSSSCVSIQPTVIDVQDWKRHTEYLGRYQRLGERHRVIRCDMRTFLPPHIVFGEWTLVPPTTCMRVRVSVPRFSSVREMRHVPASQVVLGGGGAPPQRGKSGPASSVHHRGVQCPGAGLQGKAVGMLSIRGMDHPTLSLPFLTLPS
jgi:hypothetical protein